MCNDYTRICAHPVAANATGTIDYLQTLLLYVYILVRLTVRFPVHRCHLDVAKFPITFFNLLMYADPLVILRSL